MDGFLNLYNTCAGMNSNSPREVAALLGDVNELVDNDHCIIETSNIHSASITASNSRPIDIREQNGGGKGGDGGKGKGREAPVRVSLTATGPRRRHGRR